MTFHDHCSSTDRKSLLAPRPVGSLVRSRARRTFVALMGCVMALGFASCAQDGGEDAASSASVETVVRRPLRITVREGGDIDSGKPISVRSEVENRCAIIELIDEGTYAEVGQVLARLDSAPIVDRLNNQKITVDKARSDVKQSLEELEIQKKTNEERLKQANTQLLLAQRALEGYEKGTMLLDEKRLRSELTIAEEDSKRGETEFAASQRLFEKEIIPKTQLDADELGMKKAKERVELAKGTLNHFLEFTSKDELTKLESDIAVQKIALARVEQESQSNLAQRKDQLETRQRNLVVEEELLQKLERQLAACEIRSPAAGLVVYARTRQQRGGDEPVSLGKEVREREEILSIPDLTNMVVKLDIHESSVKKISRGLKAWVSVDALPGKLFSGEVTRVGLVPSSQSSWMNPDLKVYETTVRIDDTVEGVRPGMHAQVEILVQEIPDALQVPLPAVHQSGARTFVYVAKGNAPELREIEVGMNNESHVHVISGLTEGELVYISRPSNAPDLPVVEEPAFMAANPAGAGRPMDDGNLPGGANPAGRIPGAAPGGGEPPSAERMQEMRERFQNMTEEEKEAFRQRMRNGGGGTEGGGAREGGGRPGGAGRRRRGGGDGAGEAGGQRPSQTPPDDKPGSGGNE